MRSLGVSSSKDRIIEVDGRTVRRRKQVERDCEGEGEEKRASEGIEDHSE